MSKSKKFGIERATTLVEDWYLMFEWSENPLYKEAMIEIVQKYDENVVRKVIKNLTMELTPKYLPTLAKIDEALKTETYNQHTAKRDTKTLEELSNSDEGGALQKLFLKGLKRLVNQLNARQITKEEYYRRQGDFFKLHGQTEDAEFFYECADRTAKGLPIKYPEGY